MEPLDLKLKLPTGHQVLGFESLGSTSDLAHSIGDKQDYADVEFLWIWTKRQTQGRGRRGREWLSREGNLTTTLLLRPGCGPAKGAELSFVAALAIADLVGGALRGASVQIKWPNDVLANGKKIAGILLESTASDGAQLDWLSIGMGVNLAFHPEGTPYPATDLSAEGATLSALEGLTRLIDTFSFWHGEWQKGGFAPIRQAWLARARGLGETVIARLAHEETSGVFEDLDEAGNLIIRLPSGGKRLISAGEIFFA
ncbi:MAG: biotin--[acetyl-CoA-carboxylase] ligase [Alphaproteobacteria bacterium]|nr:MAG: biotin--[acetyl-CoA-carboxylase] ligase [Alphaproteobacteria bacterium]